MRRMMAPIHVILAVVIFIVFPSLVGTVCMSEGWEVNSHFWASFIAINVSFILAQAIERGLK